MKLQTLAIATAITFQVSSFAQNLPAQSAGEGSSGGAGNGGDLLVCREIKDSEKIEGENYYPPGTYSLDYVVTHPRGPSGSDVEIKSWSESVANISQQMGRVFPEWLTDFQKFVSLIYNEDPEKAHLWDESEFPLIDLKDEDLKIKMPLNCLEHREGRLNPQIHQAMIQFSNPQRAGMFNFLYDKKLLAELTLDPLQFSYAMVHEFLWTVGFKSAFDIRPINEMLHSKKMKSITRKDFLAHLFRRQGISQSELDGMKRNLHASYASAVDAYRKKEITLQQLKNFLLTSGINPNLTLLKYSYDERFTNERNGSVWLIHTVADSGDEALLGLMREFSDFNPNLSESSENPILYALAQGQERMIETLLDLGAKRPPDSTAKWVKILTRIIDSNAVHALPLFLSGKYLRANEPNPPLHPHLIRAASGGKLEICKALVEAGANPFLTVTTGATYTYEGNEEIDWGQRETEKHVVQTYDALFAAATTGNMELFNYLFSLPGFQGLLNEPRYEVKFIAWYWDGTERYYRVDKKSLRAVVEDIVKMKGTVPSDGNLKQVWKFLKEVKAKSVVIKGKEDYL